MERKQKFIVAGVIVFLTVGLLFILSRFLFLPAYLGFIPQILTLKSVGEGEEFSADFVPSFIVSNKCKFGLKAVSAAKDVGGKFGCVYPMCDCYVCTKCGNGVCGKGENSCNCKEDCEAGEGEKTKLQDIYQPEFHKSEDFVDTGISY